MLGLFGPVALTVTGGSTTAVGLAKAGTYMWSMDPVVGTDSITFAPSPSAGSLVARPGVALTVTVAFASTDSAPNAPAQVFGAPNCREAKVTWQPPSNERDLPRY